MALSSSPYSNTTGTIILVGRTIQTDARCNPEPDDVGTLMNVLYTFLSRSARGTESSTLELEFFAACLIRGPNPQL